MLYKSNVLMYDHQTESLWSQVKREAVTGPMTGTRLSAIPFALTTWKKWKKRYPSTEVLSIKTGYSRDYSKDPYENYYKQERSLFSLFKPGPGEKEKELVAGITINGLSKAYPLRIIRKTGKLEDTLGSVKITVLLDPETDVLKAVDDQGSEIPNVIVYWFVWKGIHPETKLYKEKNS